MPVDGLEPMPAAPTGTGRAFARWLGRRRVPLVVGALAGLALGVVAGQLMQPAYEVTTVLTPVQETERAGAVGNLGGSLGGLAALAGIQIGGGGDKVEALEVLRSRQMARDFVTRNNLGAVLVPPARRLFGLLPPKEPSVERAVDFFVDRVLTITDDRRTGVVKLSIVWKDRVVAAEWANAYVALANETLRNRAIAEASSRSEYLKRQLQETQVVGVREAAFGLIETNLKNSMVAHTRLDYAFRVADPAVPPDRDDVVRPKRLLLAVFGAIALAFLLGVLLYVRDHSRDAPVARPSA